MDCLFQKDLSLIYNQYVCKKHYKIAFAYSSDTLTIPLTALVFKESVWLRQLEGAKEGVAWKTFKLKPSLLAATVTQQGQDTGHHMELQQP